MGTGTEDTDAALRAGYGGYGRSGGEPSYGAIWVTCACPVARLAPGLAHAGANGLIPASARHVASMALQGRVVGTQPCARHCGSTVWGSPNTPKRWRARYRS